MKIFLTYLFIVSASLSTWANRGIEIDTFLVNREAAINAQLKKVREAKDDNVRHLENESLKEMLEEILPYPGTFDYPFSAFTTMSTIAAPDGAFRLFNWNIEDNSGLNSHFCYMIVPNRGEKPNTVIPFKEDRITIPPKPENTLTPLNWYGALYYNIVPVRKGNKVLYTMIGYNGGSRSTNKKILDVFYFKGKKLRLGYPIFQESYGSKRLARRVFFEYSEKVTIGVNMNEKLNAIVFDHLIPETPSLEGMFDFYVPDMTYDAYRWEGTLWRYEEDLVATNKENRKTRLYDPNSEEGDDEFVEVKDVWEDPVDGNPNGGGTSAVAPVEDHSDGKKKNKRGKRQKKSRKRLFGKKSKNPRSAISN